MLSFFPGDDLVEIWDFIESVSESCSTYFYPSKFILLHYPKIVGEYLKFEQSNTDPLET